MPVLSTKGAVKKRPAYVYLVRCRDKTLYCGICYDLVKRIAQHNSGKGARYTRGRGPVELCYCEVCEDWSTALKREHELKRYGRTQKEQLVAEWRAADWALARE